MEANKLADITVLDDAVALIRRHPEMYLTSATPAEDLATNLVRDLARLGALPASLTREGPWWLVSSAMDWLHSGSGEPVTDPFFRIVPCPHWGLYAFRTEVLLTAFADAVATAAGGKVTWIAGDRSVIPLPTGLIAPTASAGSGRTVAFRMERST